MKNKILKILVLVFICSSIRPATVFAGNALCKKIISTERLNQKISEIWLNKNYMPFYFLRSGIKKTEIEKLQGELKAVEKPMLVFIEKLATCEVNGISERPVIFNFAQIEYSYGIYMEYAEKFISEIENPALTKRGEKILLEISIAKKRIKKLQNDYQELLKNSKPESFKNYVAYAIHHLELLVKKGEIERNKNSLSNFTRAKFSYENMKRDIFIQVTNFKKDYSNYAEKVRGNIVSY